METMTAFHGAVGVEKHDERRFERSWYGTFVVQFSGISQIFEKEQSKTRKRGCSSAGRAPALQAGGHGFEPHHLHQSAKADEERWSEPITK